MPTVRVRKLKKRLGFYLKQVRHGEGIEGLYQGKVIALLVPTRANTAPKELLMPVEEAPTS